MADQPQYILFPGRHHLLTVFQQQYLTAIGKTKNAIDIDGQELSLHNPKVIFAVTSSNHQQTRRNPLSFDRREAAIELFAATLPMTVVSFPIPDVPGSARFADYTIKEIEVSSRGQFRLTPANTVVACSTPAVIELYEKLGFRILPVELVDRKEGAFSTIRPWDVVQAMVAAGADWRSDPTYQRSAHEASKSILEKYQLGDLIVEVHADPLLGSEGDLTETRDYNTYARAFDEGAERKLQLVADQIQPGKIVDIGCATGSIIKAISHEPAFWESDLYGIEITRKLHELCEQRKSNGEFGNENVFFYQRNILRGKIFPDNSINTTMTFSLTHELWSYAGAESIKKFLQLIFDHTAPGGIYINVDVIGPNQPEQTVYLELAHDDGREDKLAELTSEGAREYLEQLSTYGRFIRFAKDFRKEEGDQIAFTEEEIDGRVFVVTTASVAAEFLSKKDYTDNWQSEMHERFCFFSFSDWKRMLQSVGFVVEPSSRLYRNPWIVKHRYQGRVKLYQRIADQLKAVSYPPTTGILIAKKPL